MQAGAEECRLQRFVANAEDAIAYLRGEGRYANREQYPMPTIVLLDLNMPRRNGFEILEWIRSQPILSRIHVYILSASSRREDIDRAYDLGANAYLVKPGSLDELLYMAKTLVTWLKLGRFASVVDPRARPEPVAAEAAVAHAELAAQPSDR